MFNPWVILAFIGVFIGGVVSGVKMESDHRDAGEKVALTAMHDAYVQSAARFRAAADAIANKLNAAEARQRTDRQNYERLLAEAKNAKQLSKVQCPAAGSAPGAEPVVLLNVGVWNGALKIGSAAGGDPGPVDGASGGPSFAPVDAAYSNLGENAERWARCRAQVTAWQDLARTNGWVTGSTNGGDNGNAKQGTDRGSNARAGPESKGGGGSKSDPGFFGRIFKR